jgi:dienelactone hydrolase
MYSRHLSAFAFLGLACLLQVPAGAQEAVGLDRMRAALYEYDADLALNAEVKPMPREPSRSGELKARYLVRFDSVNDQRVSAILSVPRNARGPFPAVVMLPGSGGHKDTDYMRVAADMFATMGYATLSVDSQYHGDRSRPGRSGDIHFVQKVVNRHAWIQTVVDLRRAVDYLQSRPDIARDRIGYVGISQGGMIGGTFLGVEPRIATACLVVAGAGLVEWGRRIGEWTAKERETAAVSAAMLDPNYFVGSFRKPLLLLAAKEDELIPRSATEALFNAASEPKRIEWYSGKHASAGSLLLALRDIRGFFEEHLGKNAGAR